LHEAATLGHAERVSTVLTASPWAIDTLSPDGWTALHLAAHFGQNETLAILLAAGADANLYSRAFERNLPLHAACAGGKVECALRLLPATRDMDARQGGGWTALMLAAEDGLLPVVAAMSRVAPIVRWSTTRARPRSSSRASASAPPSRISSRSGSSRRSGRLA
jgi:ankyrin repeat protein